MFRTVANNRVGSQSRKLLRRKFSTKVTNASASAQTVNENVPGLSGKVMQVPNQPVGPGAAKDKEYKNPEYFCYTATSFAEAEVEMEKFRLQAPSNKEPFKQQ